MTGIIITYGEYYLPAEIIGMTNSARLLLLSPGSSSEPKLFKSAKQARRYARKLFGAGNLDMRKWKLMPGRQSLQGGHLVKVELS